MKVLILITKGNFGGAQRYVFDIATHAQRRGIETVVACGPEGILRKKLQDAGIRTETLASSQRDISLLREFRLVRELFLLIQKERPDVLHVNSSKIGGLGALLGRVCGVKKIVFTSHGWAFNEARPEYQKMLIRLLAWLTVVLSHRTIAVSNNVRKGIESLPCIAGKISTIANGVDAVALSQAEAQREITKLLGITFGAYTELVSVAELHPNKDHATLLEAFAQLPTSTRLTLIGDGEERDRLKTQAARLQIADRVVFAGFVSSPARLLKAFDIFVLSSRTEALSYTVLEAGIAGLPVVASRVGGIPEIIEDGVSGLLAASGSSVEFKNQLERYITSPELRATHSQVLEKTVRDHFGIEQMAERTLGLYLE
jgi:glycosyltransferase involved in cell wall biosynthesis